MKEFLIFAFIVLSFGFTSCISKPKESITLPLVLEAINQIETSTYIAANYFCFPGDTVPIHEKVFEFYKECVLPSDTFVGVSFMRLEVEDTTKMTYAYAGNIETYLNWQEYNYQVVDFSNNKAPYRVVMAPFFAKSKAIIEYALNTKDSIRMDSLVQKNDVIYKITIFKKYIEFVGRLAINSSDSENDISEYELWVNRKDNLPFKIQRTVPCNSMGPATTMIDEMHSLKINNLSNEDFNLVRYIPIDMPEKTGKASDLYNVLLNTFAFNYALKDMTGHIHKLGEEKSKVYMINLTSKFCGPCCLSVSFLKKLNQKYDKKDFSFVSLYNENEKKDLAAYIKEKKILYPILLIDNNTAKKYKESLMPTFLFLDKDKKIVKIMPGFVQGVSESKIEKVIEDML